MEIETEPPNTDVCIDMNGIENGNNDKSSPKATIIRQKVPTNVEELTVNRRMWLEKGLHF